MAKERKPRCTEEGVRELRRLHYLAGEFTQSLLDHSGRIKALLTARGCLDDEILSRASEMKMMVENAPEDKTAKSVLEFLGHLETLLREKIES